MAVNAEALNELEARIGAKAWDEALVLVDQLLADQRLRSDEFYRLAETRAQLLSRLKRFDEARTQLEEARERAVQQRKRDLAQKFGHAVAMNEVAAGRREQAICDLRRELGWLTSRSEHYFLQLSTNYVEQGLLFYEARNLTEARLYFELGLAYGETDGLPAMQARALYGLALCDEAEGRLTEAARNLARVLDLYGEVKDRAGVTRTKRVQKRVRLLQSEQKGTEKKK